MVLVSRESQRRAITGAIKSRCYSIALNGVTRWPEDRHTQRESFASGVTRIDQLARYCETRMARRVHIGTPSAM